MKEVTLVQLSTSNRSLSGSCVPGCRHVFLSKDGPVSLGVPYMSFAKSSLRMATDFNLKALLPEVSAKKMQLHQRETAI